MEVLCSQCEWEDENRLAAAFLRRRNGRLNPLCVSHIAVYGDRDSAISLPTGADEYLVQTVMEA